MKNTISKICGFLHRSDHLNLDAPIAELLSAKEEDGETPKEIGMDVLFKGLPQTKKNKNLKKALTVNAATKGPESPDSIEEINFARGLALNLLETQF